MKIILWIVAGGLIGWAASAIMRTREGIALNVVVGIVGAALTGWVFRPLAGMSTILRVTSARACSLPFLEPFFSCSLSIGCGEPHCTSAR